MPLAPVDVAPDLLGLDAARSAVGVGSHFAGGAISPLNGAETGGGSVTIERPDVGPSEVGSLDLHKGLATRRHLTCSRWPPEYRLRSSAGEFVMGRCRASNLCDYCAMMASVLAAEMLALDAMTDAPTTLLVLTTRTATVDVEAFRVARSNLTRALRREWPGFQAAQLVEWTTGYGPKSGGQRRPHWNWLCKGIPVEAHEWVRSQVRANWCREVDAEPHSQHVGPIYAAGGLTRYLAMHFLKESQAPPAGFRGQRFNCSVGYFAGQTRREAREAAQESLRSKRALWRALQAGLTGEVAEIDARLSLERASALTWELVRAVGPPGRVRGFDPVGLR